MTKQSDSKSRSHVTHPVGGHPAGETSPDRVFNLVLPDEYRGKRLDQALAQLLPEHSRSFIQNLIRSRHITVNGCDAEQRAKVAGGEHVRIVIPEIEADQTLAEEIALDIVFEDEDIVVLNKPVGLVVHPGAGNRTGTLMNALLHHDARLFALPRAGIVHRLDKDTSGLMVVAKNESARQSLVEKLKHRHIKRLYLTIVQGGVTGPGSVNAPIGRHRQNRLKMAVTRNGKPAVSHYRVLERFCGSSYLQVSLESGRTHQIRVHMAHINHPVLGDPLYGGRTRVPAGVGEELRSAIQGFGHQALHAFSLSFNHPRHDEVLTFRQELPPDFYRLVQLFRQAQKRAADTGRPF